MSLIVFKNQHFLIAKFPLMLFLVFIFFCHGPCLAQSPYQVDWKKEPYFLGSGALMLGSGFFISNKVDPLTIEKIDQLSVHQINSFDRPATQYFSKDAKVASDYILYSSVILPSLFLSSKKCRDNFAQATLLYFESILLTGGLTYLTKNTFKRTRPFVYGDQIGLLEKLDKDARHSFFSGHTSIAATNYFFMAKIFSDFFPKSKWKPYVWAVAAVVPAVNGYLRVRAGKHFPTDVITGYIIGASVGFFVPHLHKMKLNEKLKIDAGISGVKLTWTLNTL